jgi:hypothetical protein
MDFILALVFKYSGFHSGTTLQIFWTSAIVTNFSWFFLIFSVVMRNVALQHVELPPSKSLTAHYFLWSPHIIRCATTSTTETAEFNHQRTSQFPICFSHSSGHLLSGVSIKLCECYLCSTSATLCFWHDDVLSFRYLTGNQLSGESSVEGYIDALKRGCRCVERAYAHFVSIGIWMGPNFPVMDSTKWN